MQTPKIQKIKNNIFKFEPKLNLVSFTCLVYYVDHSKKVFRNT